MSAFNMYEVSAYNKLPVHPQLSAAYELYNNGAVIKSQVAPLRNDVNIIVASVQDNNEMFKLKITVDTNGNIKHCDCSCKTRFCDHARAVLFHCILNESLDRRTSEPTSKGWSFKRILLPVVAGAAAVFAAPLVLGAVGFSSAGIVGGSIAAKMMSAAAIANGGGVAARSAVAVLQSAGAAGIGAAGSSAIAGVAGGTTAAGQYVYEKVAGKK